MEKSLQHLKKKLPADLSHETRLGRPLLASLYKSLPPTITIYKFIEDIMKERKSLGGNVE